MAAVKNQRPTTPQDPPDVDATQLAAICHKYAYARERNHVLDHESGRVFSSKFKTQGEAEHLAQRQQKAAERWSVVADKTGWTPSQESD